MLMATHPNVIAADDETFDAEVLASDLPVLVDFVGRWCGPCKAMAPVIERLAAEHAGRVKFVTVDTDASPQTARRYGVRGVPTVVVFRNGQKATAHLGATTREKLLALLEG
jgi:thioredoxin 1